jgi:hypothetical protein
MYVFLSSHSLISGQAGSDTLAALVARTIAAAKLKVQASFFWRVSFPGCNSKNLLQEETEPDGINPLLRDDAPN